MSEQQDVIQDMNIRDIMDCLPHRYPLLLVDKIKDIVPFKSATGIKCVTATEPYFQGHFPGNPIMPGVLIVEAMAQTSGAMVIRSLGVEGKKFLVFFMSVEEAKFRKPVIPGDVLFLHVKCLQRRGPVWRFSGVAKVDGVKVAQSLMTAMIKEA